MPILATLPNPNFFSSPPPNPKINDPYQQKCLPPPIPIPKYPPKALKSPQNPPVNPALKSFHRRTKYHKPISDGLIACEPDGRSVILGESGVSYLLPGAPFEFHFSYSETPKVKPIAIREPAYLPFAPPSMPRPWTGKAPLKKSKKKIPLLGSSKPVPPGLNGVKVVEVARPLQIGKYQQEGKKRGQILGAPLTKNEIRELVKPHLSCNRQVNLGRDGLTHNMLELVHTHWKRQKVCKVRCRGVPTVDMANVCRHLEEKTGGKIIQRLGGVIYLFRGRNYDHRTRPQYPIMLWKPATPVYPKLIQEAPEGLTKSEAYELREKGQKLLPICKLAKNGIYINLVKDVREAFEGSHLVKVNCQGMHASDYKKIGAKLKELVPCVLLCFDQEQILMWRGRDWKSMYRESRSLASNDHLPDGAVSSKLVGSAEIAASPPDDLAQRVNSGQLSHLHARPVSETPISSPKMLSLWNRAIETNKALLLDETNLGPDALLERVEEFEGLSQATEHSYPALLLPSGVDANMLATEYKDDSEGESEGESNEEYEDDIYDDDFYDELDSPVPLGSLPLDSLARRLDLE